MREVIKTGRTVEDATELALAELGVSAEEAGIEVLELPQRRLFKSIPAKVRAYVEDEEVPEAPAPKEEKPLPKAAPKAAESPDAPKAGAPAAQPEQAQPAAGPVEEPIDLEQNPKAREAVEYLKEICAKMGAQGLTITPVKQGEATILKVEGESAGTLIGHRGEVMEALSYLTSLVANRAGGDYMKIGLDINHYRSKREANLTALAKRIGAKVARTGRGHTLEPMNPYERRIIHSAISEMEGVKSESIGEGANRRVVISSTNPSARPPRDNRGGKGGKGGRPAGREQIPAQKRKARPAQPLRRRPEQQKTQPQTAYALARVHGRQPQHLPGRGQISAQHQIDAPDRHEPRQQPQAALRLRQAQRVPRDPRRGKKQPCGRQHARQQHIAEAVRRRALQPGAVAPAVGLGAKAARRDPRPGEPQRRRERRHRQHELHAAQALRADPSGQIRLEQHRKQPQQQRRSGQQ